MMLTIAIYIFTTALAFAMIARKIWQLRSGRITPGSYEEADWTDLSIESIRLRLIEIAKFSVHHFVLLMLKAWIIIASQIKLIDRKIKEWLTQVLHKNGHYPQGGKPSRYLKNIRERKDEVADALEKESAKPAEEPLS